MEKNTNYNVKRYYDTFGEFPPILKTVSWEEGVFQDLLEMAIERKQPLTVEEVASYYKDFDVIHDYE